MMSKALTEMASTHFSTTSHPCVHAAIQTSLSTTDHDDECSFELDLYGKVRLLDFRSPLEFQESLERVLRAGVSSQRLRSSIKMVVVQQLCRRDARLGGVLARVCREYECMAEAEEQ